MAGHTLTPGSPQAAPPASFNPARTLVLGFVIALILGTGLLSLPQSAQGGVPVKFIDAFFTATSALCVTGLTVVTTASTWSTFGQTVIALLVQAGGLGIMTGSLLVAVLLGKRVSLRDRLVARQIFGPDGTSNLARMFRHLAVLVLGIELLGMLLLFARWAPLHHPRRAAFLAFFHSISAFNNAGFDLFGSSLADFVDDGVVIGVIAGLVVAGGLGFVVLTDMRRWVAALPPDLDPTAQLQRGVISFHSRLALLVTGGLLVTAFAAVAALEWSNPATLGSLKGGAKLWAPLLHAVSMRSAGFYAVDPAAMTPGSQLVTMLMMFIGGSPASTAGGLKTTTLAVLAAAVISVLAGNEDVSLLQRRLAWEVIRKALAIFGLLLSLTLTVAFLLMVTEGVAFVTALFEATAAASTTGLSLALTPQLGWQGKLLIIAAMFIGRLGPLTVVLAAGRHWNRKVGIRYSEAKVLVG